MSGDNETLNAGGSSTPGQDATTVGNAWANMILGGDAGSPSDGEDTGAISGGSGNDQQADNGGSASTDFDDFDYDALFADDDPEDPEGNSGAPAPATPPAAPGTSEERGPVPYDRFREVNERAKAAQQLEARLAAWGPVIERFESEGFSNAQAVMATLEQQAAAAAEAEITAKYQAQVDENDLDPEVATARRDAELLQMRLNRQLQQMEAYQRQVESTTAWQTAKLPESVKPLFDDMVNNGYAPNTAVSILAQSYKGMRRAVAQETVQRLGKGRALPTPTTPAQTGRAAPPQGHNPNNPFQVRTLSDMLGVRRG